MSAARAIEAMGATVTLSDGRLRLVGLDTLDSDTAARVLDVARTHKAELLAELREGASAPPVPSTASPMAALVRFERDPRGVVAWLAAQTAGQERSPDMRRRFVACIQAEARLRLEGTS